MAAPFLPRRHPLAPTRDAVAPAWPPSPRRFSSCAATTTRPPQVLDHAEGALERLLPVRKLR